MTDYETRVSVSALCCISGGFHGGFLIFLNVRLLGEKVLDNRSLTSSIIKS